MTRGHERGEGEGGGFMALLGSFAGAGYCSYSLLQLQRLPLFSKSWQKEGHVGR